MYTQPVDCIGTKPPSLAMPKVHTLYNTHNPTVATSDTTPPASKQQQIPRILAAPAPAPQAFSRARNFVITDGNFTAVTGDYTEEFCAGARPEPKPEPRKIKDEDYPLPLGNHPLVDNDDKATGTPCFAYFYMY